MAKIGLNFDCQDRRSQRFCKASRSIEAARFWGNSLGASLVDRDRSAILTNSRPQSIVSYDRLTTFSQNGDKFSIITLQTFEFKGIGKFLLTIRQKFGKGFWRPNVEVNAKVHIDK